MIDSVNNIKKEKTIKSFLSNLLNYIFVNGLLVSIYYLVGMDYFWPIGSIVGWGIGLVIHGVYVYRVNKNKKENKDG